MTLVLKITLCLLPLFYACSESNLGNTNHKDAQNQEAQQTKQTAKFDTTEKIALPQNGFYCGYSDGNGDIWFGTNGNGIYKFDGKTFINYTKKDGLSNNQVFAITSDQNNTIWMGTSTGLTKFDGKEFKNIAIPQQDTSSIWLDQVYPVINPNAVHSIIQDKKGDFWIGTGGGGAYHYDQSTFTSVLKNVGMKYDDSLYHNWIPDIAEDAAGNIWFASMSYGGLTRYDGNNLKTFLEQDGLSDDMIREIFVDDEGNIWLGFNGNRKSALTVYKDETFRIYPLENNACHRSIRAIFVDNDNKVWLGGEGGICILHENNFTEFLNSDGSPFSGISFITLDSQQNMWFGGRYGLWKYDGKSISKLTI